MNLHTALILTPRRLKPLTTLPRRPSSPAYAIAIHGQRIVIAHEDRTLTLWQWTAE